MKAVITFTERSESESDRPSPPGGDLVLGIRLLAEGANDRLLLRMLEIQHPAMRRANDPGVAPNGRGEPTVVDVPMPEDDVGDGSDRMVISSRLSLNHDTNYTISETHSSRGSIIRGAELRVDHPERWEIRECRMNGRALSMRDGRPLLGDVPRGALVELDVNRASCYEDGDDGVFRATIEGGRGLRVGGAVELIDGGGPAMVVAAIFEYPAADHPDVLAARDLLERELAATKPGGRVISQVHASPSGVVDVRFTLDTFIDKHGQMSTRAAHRVPAVVAQAGGSVVGASGHRIVAWWRDDGGAPQIAEFDARDVRPVG